MMDLSASYNAVADEYVRRIYDELQHKPLDRELLDRFASNVGNEGLICDLGCGPGQVARYLYDRGAWVIGVDLSTAMVERARVLNPGIEFRPGDMRQFVWPDAEFAGIVAFYSLIHIHPAEMVTTLQELHRVLHPGGQLLIAFHIGDETLHLDEWWGQRVCVDFHFFRTELMQSWLEQAGVEVQDVIEREPYPEVEHASRRAYVFARSRTVSASDEFGDVVAP